MQSDLSMSDEEAQYYSDLEAEMCRCDGDDATACYPHNPRYHSMDGVEEYDRLHGDKIAGRLWW